MFKRSPDSCTEVEVPGLWCVQSFFGVGLPHLVRAAVVTLTRYFSVCMSELRQKLGEINSWIHISAMPQMASSSRLRTAACRYAEGLVHSWCSPCWADRLAAPFPNILQVLKWRYISYRNPSVGPPFAFHCFPLPSSIEHTLLLQGQKWQHMMWS